MLSEKEWREKCEVIWAMHKIMRNFSNAGSYFDWALNGVPNWIESIEELMDMFGNDEDFEMDYKRLTKLFCEIVAYDTASIARPPKGTDFPPLLKLDGNMVII